jgi:transcriptional regulator with XRE-family HTH domain
LRGLTQEELAHRAGVSVKTIQRIESPRPRHDLRASTIRKVAAVLGLDTTALLVLLYGYDNGNAGRGEIPSLGNLDDGPM